MTYLINPGSNGFHDRTASTLSYDDGTRTFTLAPVADSFLVRVRGRDLRITGSQAVVWDDVTGIHRFYLDEDGTLQYSDTFVDEIITRYAFVSEVYWNATAGTTVLRAEERHGLMPAEVHLYAHRAHGAQLDRAYASGLFGLTLPTVSGNGDDDTHAQLALTDGRLIDEDLELSGAETGQKLIGVAQLPTLYRLGADPGEWYLAPAGNFPMLYDGRPSTYTDGRVPANTLVGGVWGLDESSNNDYVILHVIAVNDVRHRVVSLQGSEIYASTAAAEAGAAVELTALQLSGLPGAEFKPLYSLILQTGNGYSNEPKARWRPSDVVDFIDWRSTGLILESPPPSESGFTNGASTVLDGVDEYVACGSFDTLDDATEATLSAWIKLGTPPATATFLSQNVNSPNRAFDLSIISTGTKLQVALYGSVTGVWQSASFTADTDWHSVIVVYDGGGASDADKLQVYRDGVDVTSAGSFVSSFPSAFPGAAGRGTAPLWIGARPDASKYWPGNLDEVAIWAGVAATAAKAGEIYGSGAPPNLAALATMAAPSHSWRMGDGDTFPTLTDGGLVGGFDGTCTNMESTDIEDTDVPGGA